MFFFCLLLGLRNIGRNSVRILFREMGRMYCATNENHEVGR